MSFDGYGVSYSGNFGEVDREIMHLGNGRYVEVFTAYKGSDYFSVEMRDVDPGTLTRCELSTTLDDP